MRQKGIVAIGPKQRIECRASLLRAGLHDHPPIPLQTGFQQTRKHLFQRPQRQMVEQDLGHDVQFSRFINKLQVLRHRTGNISAACLQQGFAEMSRKGVPALIWKGFTINGFPTSAGQALPETTQTRPAQDHETPVAGKPRDGSRLRKTGQRESFEMALRIALFFGLVIGLAGVTTAMGTVVVEPAGTCAGAYKTC